VHIADTEAIALRASWCADTWCAVSGLGTDRRQELPTQNYLTVVGTFEKPPALTRVASAESDKKGVAPGTLLCRRPQPRLMISRSPRSAARSR
jgi:hypothetical protein